ncbi:hypothetical protein B566_EDAN018367 [Ephemera danica]|nr:hypothetical protein B566_EDAN018367 [Ephemera danica]
MLYLDCRHTTTTQYWADATEQTLTDEFAGEKETIAKFANIPVNDITGVRTPFLVLSGDRHFNVMSQNNFYDLTWPTMNFVGKGVFPYSLDYLSLQV